MKFELIAIGELKPDFVSGRIQKAIGANYSHIAILVDDHFIYHAIGEGVEKTTLGELMGEKPCAIRRRVIVPVKAWCCAKTWLEARLDTPYSNAQYLGFIFPWLRWVPFVNNGRSKMVCSEFGADFLQECSLLSEIAQDAYTDSDFIDPKQCMDIAAGIYGELEDGI